LYVDGDATGAGDGTSWDDALTSLRNALLIAAACDNVDEIWVAQGVYTPGFFRSDSFHILPDVAIYGGFSASEEELEDRDWDAYPTVLSGDIGRDNVTDARGVVTDTANIKNDNAYHVVMLDGTTTPITASTRLDGVIITAGHAKSNFPNNVGGGLYCDGTAGMCNPTLAHVTFSGNQAEGNGGGAMYNNGRAGGQSSP